MVVGLRVICEGVIEGLNVVIGCIVGSFEGIEVGSLVGSGVVGSL